MKEIYDFAQGTGIPIHLDGARIFNAATALGVPVHTLTQFSDSVMFCLSKGLCAPVGSLLAGSEAFIERARKIRKMLGGGIRQGGILAAAGLVALKDMTGRLEEDHQNARTLAMGLNQIPGLRVDMNTVQTNIVVCELTDPEKDLNSLLEQVRGEGLLVNAIDERRIRFVTHFYISPSMVEDTITIFANFMKSS
jgi:threonine aldolase